MGARHCDAEVQDLPPAFHGQQPSAGVPPPPPPLLRRMRSTQFPHSVVHQGNPVDAAAAAAAADGNDDYEWHDQNDQNGYDHDDDVQASVDQDGSGVGSWPKFIHH